MGTKPTTKQKRKPPHAYHWKCNHCGDVIKSRFGHPPWRKHKCGHEDWVYDGYKR